MTQNRQHDPLRVPAGWEGQARAFVIHLENLFSELYNKFGRLRMEDLGDALKDLLKQYGESIESQGETIEAQGETIEAQGEAIETLQGSTVTNVAYDSRNKKLTKTINSVVSDIVTVAVLKAALDLTKSDVGLSNAENKSSATIRSELTSGNVTDALGFTPADAASTVTDVAYDSTNKKITETTNGTTTDVVSVATIQSALSGFTWGAIKGS